MSALDELGRLKKIRDQLEAERSQCNADIAAAIARARTENATMEQIADALDVTRQGVRHIVQKHGSEGMERAA